MRFFSIIVASLFFWPVLVFGQEKFSFRSINFDSLGVTPYQLYTTREGVTWISSSAGLWRIRGSEINGPLIHTGILYDNENKKGNEKSGIRQYVAEDSIRAMAQGADSLFYFVAHDNFFIWRPNGTMNGLGFPPFVLPKSSAVTALLIHDDGDVFAGTRSTGLFVIEQGGRKKGLLNQVKSEWGENNDYIIRNGGKKIRLIKLPEGAGVLALAADFSDPKLIWMGTDKGLFRYHRITGEMKAVTATGQGSAITDIETGIQGKVLFSTLEKGIGVLNTSSLQFDYFSCRTSKSSSSPVRAISYKSANEVFVAVADTFPAIFNLSDHSFRYIENAVFEGSRGQISDIVPDSLGRLLVLKGKRLFIGENLSSNVSGLNEGPSPSFLVPQFISIQSEEGKEIATRDYHSHLLKKLILSHRQNSVIINYTAPDFSQSNPLQFAWKMEGYTGGWIEMPVITSDKDQFLLLQDLKPGKYLLQLKVKPSGGDWRKTEATLEIIVNAPFWKSTWFVLLLVLFAVMMAFVFIEWRIRRFRKEEKLKSEYEHQLMQLEAQALRSQMNPHFIYNCLNSIKSLMQENETEKGVSYLTTFSKLIRTLFNNADKKLITLYDEVETCKLYLQLETMRFDARFMYSIEIDDQLDLKSIFIPALIIQPFIENAIWHGIIPKGNEGKLSLFVKRNNNLVEIIVEDDGVGREVSMQSKSRSNITHQSKGVNLTQARIELDNLLRQQEAGVQVIDKKDSSGNPAGTKVVITLKIPE